MDMNKGGGNCRRELEVLGEGGQRGKNWDTCNSIINKKVMKITVKSGGEVNGVKIF